jgi:hypothetical protein
MSNLANGNGHQPDGAAKRAVNPAANRAGAPVAAAVGVHGAGGHGGVGHGAGVDVAGVHGVGVRGVGVHGTLPSGAGRDSAGGGGPSSSRGTLDALRQRRLELAERVAGLTWDLGGLTYEMAVRDHYRLDVLARRAAELQEADAQLGEVERLLAAAEAGIHGQCRSCGAVHSRGAAYCWHCGVSLLSEVRPSVLASERS